MVERGQASPDLAGLVGAALSAVDAERLADRGHLPSVLAWSSPSQPVTGHRRRWSDKDAALPIEGGGARRPQYNLTRRIGGKTVKVHSESKTRAHHDGHLQALACVFRARVQCATAIRSRLPQLIVGPIRARWIVLQIEFHFLFKNLGSVCFAVT
jgi:hypothetical protein